MSVWHSDLHLLTGAYAVDALEPAEHDAFERHLASCGSCATETRGLAETAARLGYGVTLPPPEAMRQRVLEATYQIRQLPPVTSPLSHRQHDRPRYLERLGKLIRSGQGQGRGQLRLPRLGIAIAAGMAVASLVAVIVLGTAQIRATHQLNTAQSVAAVLSASDVHSATSAADGGGSVTVILSRSLHEAVVTTADMRPLPSSEVYQLWLMGPGGTRSAGLISGLPTSGAAPLLASGIATGDRFGITVEPAGGTSQPTTSPVAVVPLPS